MCSKETYGSKTPKPNVYDFDIKEQAEHPVILRGTAIIIKLN